MQKLFLIYIILGEEGHWIWPHSGIDLTVSYWGPNHPNTDSSNTEDCGVMVVQPDSFLWEDITCLTTEVHQNRVAPICEKIQSVASCPAGWEEFEGSCYLMVSTGTYYWQNAENYCKSKGGHLASIHSKAEGDFIIELAGSSHFYIWLGATDVVSPVNYFQLNI